LEVGSEVLDALGGGANVTLEVALCLSSPLKKEVGKPFLRGHWLSKKTFELRPPKLSEDFDVEPMGDDGWKAMGLPPKTLYHVDYYGYVNEQASKDRQIAKVRIHSDVYKKLTADSATKMNRPLMSFLAAEIPCQILASSVTEWSEVEQPTPRSPLSAFLKRINRIQPCDLKQLAAMAKEPGMPRLRAVLHADQLTVRHIAEA
jgi:hypothetical protein